MLPKKGQLQVCTSGTLCLACVRYEVTALRTFQNTQHRLGILQNASNSWKLSFHVKHHTAVSVNQCRRQYSQKLYLLVAARANHEDQQQLSEACCHFRAESP